MTLSGIAAAKPSGESSARWLFRNWSRNWAPCRPMRQLCSGVVWTIRNTAGLKASSCRRRNQIRRQRSSCFPNLHRPNQPQGLGAGGPLVPKQSLERSGEKLAESAEKIKRSTHGVEDSAARTTELAADRTVFAAEPPTLLGCVPASWLWRAALERRHYFRRLFRSGWSLPLALSSSRSAHSVLVQQYGAIWSPECLLRKSMYHGYRHGFWSPWMDFLHSWRLLRL